MRGIVWLGAATAALLIAVAAVIGLRGTVPPGSPRPPASAAAPPPSQAAARPATAPAAPAIPPSFDIVTLDPQGQAVIAGRALPGDRVRVLDGGQPIGEVTADARGEWVLVPEAKLAPGNRQLALEATGRDGGPVRRSADVVALSVTPPVSAGGSPSTLAVLLPGDADRPARVLQQPPLPPAGETVAGEAAAGQKLALETAEYGAHHRLMLSGHADPAARLNIYAGDRLIGTVTADSAGKWALTASHPAPPGGVELRLDELAADGSVAYRVAAPFEAIGTGVVAPGGNYVVRRGNSLWVISRQLYGEGFRYTAIYSANRDQIRDPNKIYPGQMFKLPKS